MNIVERYDKQIRYSSVINYFVLSVQYALLWITAKQAGPETIKSYCAIVAFEFILVHSGIFMFGFAKLKFTLPIFLLFYGLFAYVINKSLTTNGLIISYMLIMLQRIRTIFFSTSNVVFNRFVYSFKVAIIYVSLMVFLVVIKDYIPGFGMSGPVTISDNNMVTKIQPHILLTFGTFYFLILAYLEYRALKKQHSGKIIL